MKLYQNTKRIVLFIGFALCVCVPAMAGEITVSAAASLTNVFQELKPLFEKSAPGTTLLFNFAASGPLLKQLEAGAPVDVFASADQETMNQAASRKLIDDGARKDFTANTLVMIVPADSKLGLNAPEDLTNPKVERIAIGNPGSVPAGRYASQALKAAGLYDALQPRFIQGESVRQVLDYVSRGEVQAGFVYKTDALIAKDKVLVAAEVGGHEAVTYPAAVVAASQKRADALKFVAFLVSPEGQAVLGKYGFKKP